MDFDVECEDCGWSGYDYELIEDCRGEDICPECGGDNLTDLSEEEEESD